MKSAFSILLVAIAVFACVLVSRAPVSSSEPPTAVERGEPALPPATTERSADDALPASHPVLETAPAAVSISRIEERELSERLWTIFNSDLQDQTQFVEHELIAELIRNDPGLARALAKEAAR